MKEKLFSVTASDCKFDYYVGSGSGGQKRNKTSNCVRCTHIASGAVGKSEEGRSQRKNKETAFRRMAESDRFQKWHRVETSRRLGTLQEIESAVERSMKDIKVEYFENGKWNNETEELKELERG